MNLKLMPLSSFVFKKSIIRKVPLVLQYEAVECGAASLSMLLRYYGLFIPLGEIRRACGVNRDGSNLMDIRNYARTLGLELKGSRIYMEELIARPDYFPCMILWENCHFLIVEGVGRDGRIFLADPAQGRYSVSQEEFHESYSGIMMSGKPDHQFKPDGEDESELASLLNYLRPYKLPILSLLILVVGLVIPNLVIPGVSGAFLNDFLVSHRFEMGMPIIWISILMTCLVVWFELTKSYISRRMLLRLQRKITLSIAKKLFSNPYSFYITRYTGDIANRLLIGMQVSEILVSDLIGTSLEVIGAILVLPFVLLISWQLTAASLVYISLSITFTFLVTRSLRDVNRSIQIDTGKLSGHSVRIISDLETIKSSGLEQSYLGKWQDLYAPLLDKNLKLQEKMNGFASLISLLNAIYEYGTIILSGLLVITGNLNLAGFVAFQALRAFFIGPLVGLSDLASTLQTAEASLGRLTDLNSVASDPLMHSLDLIPSDHRETVSTNFDQNLKSVKKKSIIESGSISAEDINFSFGEIKDLFLRNINFDLKQGEMMTIVGPSGSGKSTLIKLLTGFYTAASGQILYDGLNWTDYDDNTIRPALGYVSQDVTAIRGSIEENILFLRPGFTTKQVREAASMAELDELVTSLPNSYSTELGDSGSGLSGGQLQRLEIARAIIKKPKILFLDEATSSLDVNTERKLLGNLRNSGFTLVCVAHRLLSAEISDHVMVLKDGLQVEYGNPNQLRNQDSIYRELLIAEEGQQ